MDRGVIRPGPVLSAVENGDHGTRVPKKRGLTNAKS
jgi:hypothetical protein